MKITLPDGTTRQYDQLVTPARIAADIGAGLAQAAIGAKVDGQLWDLSRSIEHDAIVTIITRPRIDKKGRSKGEPDPDALYLLRHSTAHVFAEAVVRIWPQVLLAYGPPIDRGFYYDLCLDIPISSDDFGRIEQEMKRIIAEDRHFSRFEHEPDSGMKKLETEGNKYKIDNAKRAIDGGAICLSWYATGEPGYDWEDLCMGPHVPSTGHIGAFKVMSIATSHWHGDIKSDRFQRVYGTAFFTQVDLDAHLEKLEQARHRDHRVVGQKLGLFAIDEQVGQGLILWKPRGAIIRDELQKFIMGEQIRRGYFQVFTPHIGKLDLYKTSGHYPYYQKSQYPPLVSREQIRLLADENCSCAELSNRMDEGAIDGYLLKPMNCPHHISIYRSDKHSYRDLPVRLAEFGTVYRWEQSGELTGMTRVRGFTQDDAHLFCTADQVKDEVRGTVELSRFVLNTFNFNDVEVYLSIRDPQTPEKYVGNPSVWDVAERELQEVLDASGLAYTTQPGEANFYGPKIDFSVKDVIGRKWQLGTVQLDYNLPQRFDLTYVGADNKAHRPVIIHRTPFGSMERFVGVLIEHYNGAFPLWLSPDQVRVLTISDKFNVYGHKVLDALKNADLRASIDTGNDRVNAKIKVAQDQKIPYMLVVGSKDEAVGAVSVRDRVRGDLGAMPLKQFIAQANAEVDSHGQRSVIL